MHRVTVNVGTRCRYMDPRIRKIYHRVWCLPLAIVVSLDIRTCLQWNKHVFPYKTFDQQCLGVTYSIVPCVRHIFVIFDCNTEWVLLKKTVHIDFTWPRSVWQTGATGLLHSICKPLPASDGKVIDAPCSIQRTDINPPFKIIKYRHWYNNNKIQPFLIQTPPLVEKVCPLPPE